jgi:DNA-binding response OmpR family regulator
MQPSEFGESSRPTREILRESEERFRLLVEGVKDYAIFMIDVEARAHAASFEFDVAVLDLALPDGNGLDLSTPCAGLIPTWGC